MAGLTRKEDQPTTQQRVSSLQRPNHWALDNESQTGSQNSSLTTSGEYSLFAKSFAEFIGDTAFVFVGAMQANVYEASPSSGLTAAALTHGFALFALISAFGRVSGGHFNPAVSLAATIAGKLSVVHLPVYVVAQLLGGFCGALLSAVFKAVMTRKQLIASSAGATLLNPANFWWEGLINEIVSTFFLVNIILMVAMDTDTNSFAPLAIGLMLAADIFATASVTGASMNPARSLASNLVAQIFVADDLPDGFWSHHYIYWAGPFGGALLAAIVYRSFCMLMSRPTTTDTSSSTAPTCKKSTPTPTSDVTSKTPKTPPKIRCVYSKMNVFRVIRSFSFVLASLPIFKILPFLEFVVSAYS